MTEKETTYEQAAKSEVVEDASRPPDRVYRDKDGKEVIEPFVELQRTPTPFSKLLKRVVDLNEKKENDKTPSHRQAILQASAIRSSHTQVAVRNCLLKHEQATLPIPACFEAHERESLKKLSETLIDAGETALAADITQFLTPQTYPVDEASGVGAQDAATPPPVPETGANPGAAPDGAEAQGAAVPAASETTNPVVVKQTAEASPTAPERTPPESQYVFRQTRTKVWEIRYPGGDILYLEDQDGLRYIAHLIQKQGEDVAVDALYFACRTDNDRPNVEREEALDSGLSLGGLGNDDVVDSEGIERIMAEIKSLNDEIDATEHLGGSALDEKKAQRAQLLSHLSQSRNVSGKSRKLGSTSKYSTVKQRIDKALDMIREHDKGLWEHLIACVTTGTACTYKPDKHIDWEM